MELTRETLENALTAAGLPGAERAALVWERLGGEPQPLHRRLVLFLRASRYFPHREYGHRAEALAAELIASGLTRYPAPGVLEVTDRLAMAGITLRQGDGQVLTRNAAAQALRLAGVPGEEGPA